MAGNGLTKTAYLALDELATNPRLARRLPVELARRFHALPLAEDRPGGRVTVAMAYPDDVAARQVIESTLGTPLYVVQADPSTIDSLVAEIWGEEAGPPLDLAVCDADQPAADASAVGQFAQSLAHLLGARLSHLTTIDSVEDLILQKQGAAHDLVICGEAESPLMQRLFSTERIVLPFSLLVAQRPRWPLKRILLILCGEASDCAAVEWASRLARLSGSAVTVLAVVPPAPHRDESHSGADRGLPGLLSSDTHLGRQMQTVARHLVNSGIASTLRLRQGPPEWQIAREVVDGDYDLIAVAAQLCHWWRRWLDRDLIGALLDRTDRPVLVAVPAAAAENQ